MFTEFERLAGTDLLVAVALAVFIVPANFLALVAYAGSRRMAGREIGARLTAALCAAGGASVGTMLLFAPDVVIAAPLLLVLGAIAVGRWRARQRVQAGWLLLGTGLPIVIAWLLVLALPDPDAGPMTTAGLAWLA